ncbi:MAG: diadenylate cyclase [Acidobacteriia bacterium]|nr:diadenylate cyclase [Terriglobia bacterium]
MPDTLEVVHALYCSFFERGVGYFFPEAALTVERGAAEVSPTLQFLHRTDGRLDLVWMGTRYHLEQTDGPFSEDQLRLLGAVGAVLSARYRGIFFPASAASTSQLFEGLAEDRYVSAFLDHFPYLEESGLPATRDVVAGAIEVLRLSSLITYENRRVSTGVILFGEGQSACEGQAGLPGDAMPYSSPLVAIKSFHRLCDGLHTLFLVNREGMLVDLVDIVQFSCACPETDLPAPSPARYRAHSLATVRGGNICLVLTPNGEIKVFARGVQVFHFVDGRWHLTDLTEKYRRFRKAAGETALAERLFTAALNLAENRRGGLFVVLDDPESARGMVAAEDLLANQAPGGSNKAQLHYLLRERSVLDLELRVLQSIAQADGGIVMDRQGRLLAFGAILRSGGLPLAAQEGGRATAAMHASRFGLALKISEDGPVSFYRGGQKVWEI